MASRLFPTQWSNTAGYSSGDRVKFSGVVYQARTTIDAPTGNNTNRMPFDNDTQWEFSHVERAEDLYGIIETIRFIINVDENPEITNSIPYGIQMAENSFMRELRVTNMKRIASRPMLSESRLTGMQNLIEIINIRIRGDNLDQPYLEIREGDYREFITAKNTAETDFAIRYDNEAIPGRRYVYFKDREYIYIAPEIPEGTMMEIFYYEQEPSLGTTSNLVNDAGMPINSAGQTIDQWVAAGNAIDTFVQATRFETANWFTVAAPELYIYGCLLSLEAWLKDDPRIPLWADLFGNSRQEVQAMIDRFEVSGPQAITMDYAGAI